MFAVVFGPFDDRSLVAQTPSAAAVRELLELHGIDQSQMERFQDNEMLNANDEETLIRILQRFPRFPREKLERWSRGPSVEWSAVSAAPADHRAEIFPLLGRATKIDRIPLLPEVAERVEFRDYFRVTLKLTNTSDTAVICTRFVPSAWESLTALDEPAGATGIFLKTGALVDGARELIFIADRVAWFPSKADPSFGITPYHTYLASLGFDIGLLDAARAENKKPLSLTDRECFYSLLAAVGRSQWETFRAHSQQPIDIVELLREPDRHHGKLVAIQGIARRAVRVRVDDADIRERFDLDHYFQIDLFVDLGNKVIKIGKEKGEGELPIFENSYPVTVCVRSLPPNLPEADMLRENIQVHATFFKLWTYSSDYVATFDKRLLQLSPMLIGIEPEVVQLPTFDPGFGIGLAVLVIVSLAGLWLGLRRQRGATDGLRVRSVGVDQNTLLPDRPDFSRLEGQGSSDEGQKSGRGSRVEGRGPEE